MEASCYCTHCRTMVLATGRRANHLLHLILTLVTGGLWILGWAIIALIPVSLRCRQCGVILSARPDPIGTALFVVIVTPASVLILLTLLLILLRLLA